MAEEKTKYSNVPLKTTKNMSYPQCGVNIVGVCAQTTPSSAVEHEVKQTNDFITAALNLP